MLSSCVCAQQTPRANADDVGRTLTRCLNEVERLRTACRSAEEVRTLEAKVKAAENLLGVYKGIIEHEEAERRDEANIGAGRYVEMQRRIREYETQLVVARGAIDRLIAEGRSARRARNVFVTIAVGLGVGLGWALSRMR